MAEIGPSSLGVVHSSCSLEGPLAWAIWWPAQLAPGGPPPHSSVSGHPRRRQLWPLGDGSNCITCAGHLLCCHVQPLHSCTSLSHSRPRLEWDASRGWQEHPRALELLSCEAKFSGDGGPGSCPHGGCVGDLVGTRWCTKQGVALFIWEAMKGRCGPGRGRDGGNRARGLAAGGRRQHRRGGGGGGCGTGAVVLAGARGEAGGAEPGTCKARRSKWYTGRCWRAWSHWRPFRQWV